MNITKKHILFFVICSFLTVVTTLAIHVGTFDIETNSIEEQASLYQNFTYNLGLWWIIAHCLLVLLSMWGIFLIQYKKALPLTGFGFLFFTLFSFTEIYRQFFHIFYLNGQYKRYTHADNSELRNSIYQEIQSFNLTSYSLFGFFILAFAIGNLCYGLSLIKGSNWDKFLGAILLIWAFQGFLTLGNEFWEINWLGNLNVSFSLIFQPLARLSIGLWFFNWLYNSSKHKLIDYNFN